MLRNLGDFMRYYSLRHAAIVRVRNDDPIIYVPKGRRRSLGSWKLIKARNPPWLTHRARPLPGAVHTEGRILRALQLDAYPGLQARATYGRS